MVLCCICVLRFIDQGHHPDEYVRHIFETAQKDNQICKGRVDAIDSFRQKLLQQAQAAFPEDMEVYK
jgi:hypothetical protein